MTTKCEHPDHLLEATSVVEQLCMDKIPMGLDGSDQFNRRVSVNIAVKFPNFREALSSLDSIYFPIDTIAIQ